MALMTQDPEGSVPAGATVTRLGEDDWRLWREVRLTALADSPTAFGSTVEDEQAIAEDRWREMVRSAAIFVARAGDQVVGTVAGLYRDSAEDRGLGAMWVAPQWRGRGVAGQLVAAVADWSRSDNAVRLGLWVPDDNARARRFYEHEGFRLNGERRFFPGAPNRQISEMWLSLRLHGRFQLCCERPPHTERRLHGGRLSDVIGRFARRGRNFSLIPGVCVMVLLAACGSSAASAPGAAQRVPASARVLTVTLTYGAGSEPPGSHFRPASVTITDLARVRQVAGLIDGLSPVPPTAEWSCPAFTLGAVNLAFRNSVSGKTLFAADLTVSNCPGFVELSIGGTHQFLGLSGSFSSQVVLHIAGIRAPTHVYPSVGAAP
jgi:GNAT superfamily N-acetyltransferase